MHSRIGRPPCIYRTDHYQPLEARDGECIDNMDQALERAVENGVKELVVQPTH